MHDSLFFPSSLFAQSLGFRRGQHPCVTSASVHNEYGVHGIFFITTLFGEPFCRLCLLFPPTCELEELLLLDAVGQLNRISAYLVDHLFRVSEDRLK